MPPVAIAIGAAVVGAAVAVSAMRAKLKTPKAEDVDRGYELSRKLDSNYPREIAVGKFATGGSGVYDTVSGAENKYVWRVTAISDYEITSLDEIWIDGQKVTLSGDPLTGWVNVTDHLTKENGDPTIRFRIMKGTEGQALDSELAAAAGPGSFGGQLTASDTFAGMAIAIMRWEHSPDDNITSEPSQIVYVGEGAPVHDPRDETSDPDDPSTWSRTSDARFNPALIAAQAIRGWKRGGEVVVGAHGIVTADIPEAALGDAADICDEEIETDEGTEARYRCGGMIRMDPKNGIRPSLEKVMAAMDGDLVENGGEFTILAGVERVAANHYDLASIGGRILSFDEHGAATNRYNETACSFVDPDSAWEMQDLPAYKPAAHLTADENRHRVQDIALDFVFSRFQATRIQKSKHERSRLFATATFDLPLIAEETEPGDWFTVTDRQTGQTTAVWEAQTVSRVNSRDRGCRVIIQAQGIAVDPWGWDQDDADAVVVPTPPTYPIGEVPAPAVPVLTLSATSVSGGGATFPAIVAAFEVAESPLETHVEFEYWPTSDDTEIRGATCLKSAGQRVLIEGVAPSTDYRVRARLIGGTRVGQWSEPSAVTTSADFIANDATIPSGLIEDARDAINDRLEEADETLADAASRLAGLGATAAHNSLLNWLEDPLFRTGTAGYVAVEGTIMPMAGTPRGLEAFWNFGETGAQDTKVLRWPGRKPVASQDSVQASVDIETTGSVSSVTLQAVWYDAAGDLLSTSDIYAGDTGRIGGVVAAPEDAAQVEIRIVPTVSEAGYGSVQIHRPKAAYALPGQTTADPFEDPDNETVSRIASLERTVAGMAEFIRSLQVETRRGRAGFRQNVTGIADANATSLQYFTSLSSDLTSLEGNVYTKAQADALFFTSAETNAAIAGFDLSLNTSFSNLGDRVSDIEGAGYLTEATADLLFMTSAEVDSAMAAFDLSLNATFSSVADRVGDLETAGFLTEASADLLFMTSAEVDSAISVFDLSLNTSFTDLSDRVGTLEGAGYLTEAEANLTFLALADAEGAFAEFDLSLNAQFSALSGDLDTLEGNVYTKAEADALFFTSAEVDSAISGFDLSLNATFSALGDRVDVIEAAGYLTEASADLLFMTAAETSSAIAAFDLSLNATFTALSDDLSTNYYTKAQADLEFTTLADVNSAISTFNLASNASFNTLSSSVSVNGSAIANIEGNLESSYAFTLTAGDKIGGMVALNDGTTTSVNFAFDFFVIEGVERFTFDTETGTFGAPNLVVDTITAGSVTANSIESGQLGTRSAAYVDEHDFCTSTASTTDQTSHFNTLTLDTPAIPVKPGSQLTAKVGYEMSGRYNSYEYLFFRSRIELRVTRSDDTVVTYTPTTWQESVHIHKTTSNVGGGPSVGNDYQVEEQYGKEIVFVLPTSGTPFVYGGEPFKKIALRLIIEAYSPQTSGSQCVFGSISSTKIKTYQKLQDVHAILEAAIDGPFVNVVQQTVSGSTTTSGGTDGAGTIPTIDWEAGAIVMP
jgi:hypothetical protein